MDVSISRSPSRAANAILDGTTATLYTGDCLDLIRSMPDESVDLTLTSPPYCMGKEYDKSSSVDDFIATQELILPQIVRITKTGGSICWQVGYHVEMGAVYPLDYAVFSALHKMRDVSLRNRVIWTFGFGQHPSSRLSGRHETALWFTKGSDYFFNLDAIRIPQKYPGKRHYKGPKKGQFSGNPRGKNPGDVWEIPNVRFGHREKVGHPCQFPVALAERFVRALCPKRGIVFDPYSGSGSTGVAAALNGCRYLGCEIDNDYQQIARTRLKEAYAGKVRFRPIEQPLYVPGPNESVAATPPHFLEARI